MVKKSGNNIFNYVSEYIKLIWFEVATDLLIILFVVSKAPNRVFKLAFVFLGLFLITVGYLNLKYKIIVGSTLFSNRRIWESLFTKLSSDKVNKSSVIRAKGLKAIISGILLLILGLSCLVLFYYI